MSHLLLIADAVLIENYGLIIAIVAGAIAGSLAQVIVPSRVGGILFTIIVGMAGGILGKKFLGGYIHITKKLLVNEILTAMIGAILIVVVINLILGIFLKGSAERDKYERTN